MQMQSIFYGDDEGFMNRLTKYINEKGSKIADLSDKDYEDLMLKLKNREI